MRRCFDDPLRLVRIAVACAPWRQRQRADCLTPSPEAKGQPAPQGFRVVLVLGEGQSTTIAENVPLAARKALADMKDFLPYRGYRLLDAAWILGSQRSTSRLRGPDDQEYQLTVVTVPQAGGRMQVRFLLQEPGPTVLAVREADEAAARRAEEAAIQDRLERMQRERGRDAAATGREARRRRAGLLGDRGAQTENGDLRSRPGDVRA